MTLSAPCEDVNPWPLNDIVTAKIQYSSNVTLHDESISEQQTKEASQTVCLEISADKVPSPQKVNISEATDPNKIQVSETIGNTTTTQTVPVSFIGQTLVNDSCLPSDISQDVELHGTMQSQPEEISSMKRKTSINPTSIRNQTEPFMINCTSNTTPISSLPAEEFPLLSGKALPHNKTCATSGQQVTPKKVSYAQTLCQVNTTQMQSVQRENKTQKRNGRKLEKVRDTKSFFAISKLSSHTPSVSSTPSVGSLTDDFPPLPTCSPLQLKQSRCKQPQNDNSPENVQDVEPHVRFLEVKIPSTQTMNKQTQNVVKVEEFKLKQPSGKQTKDITKVEFPPSDTSRNQAKNVTKVELPSLQTSRQQTHTFIKGGPLPIKTCRKPLRNIIKTEPDSQSYAQAVDKIKDTETHSTKARSKVAPFYYKVPDLLPCQLIALAFRSHRHVALSTEEITCTIKAMFQYYQTCTPGKLETLNTSVKSCLETCKYFSKVEDSKHTELWEINSNYIYIIKKDLRSVNAKIAEARMCYMK